MHRVGPPPLGRPDPTKLSGVHRKVRRVKKPSWNDAQHDLTEYKPSAQELLEKKLRLMSKEQLMRLAGITPPSPPTQQLAAASQHSNEETHVGDSSADKENVKPESASAAVRPLKLSKPAAPSASSASYLTTAPSVTPAPLASSIAVSRERMQSVVTAAPAVVTAPTETTHHLAPLGQRAALGYHTELRAGALLSPVLERSIEGELDAESLSQLHWQPPLDALQQQHTDDVETQQLIARIDHLTAASPERPLTSLQPTTTHTPDRRAQPALHDVAATMQQLANTPPQLPNYTPLSPLPPLHPATPPHLYHTSPASAALAPPSTPSIHHRLFLLLKQVASHLESLSSRQSTDATERAGLVRQLEDREREIGQLQAKVQGLEGGLVLVQRQLLAMQRNYDEQLSSMVDALTQLEQRQPAVDVAHQVDAIEPAADVDGDSKKRTFAVPPPFVSSQTRTSSSPLQHVSLANHSHRAAASSATLLTPMRLPFVTSPARPASSASFLASPSPPRAGRSPRRTVARWDEVSNLEQRLHIAAAHHTHPNYHTPRGDNSNNHTQATIVEERSAGVNEDAVTMIDLSASSSSTFSSLPVPSLPVPTKRSGRRSAGWPQHTAGWTVHT